MFGAALGALLALAAPALALAHPLGNFTINHYAGIRVEPDRVVLDVVIDQAEIPTFQEKLRIDTDGDGLVSDAEAEAERTTACRSLASSLSLEAGGIGSVLTLVPVQAGLSFPPGAAGLETMRLVCVYTAPLPSPLTAGTQIAFRDTSSAERIGWREIVVAGSGVTVAAGELPRSSVSDRLRAYPQELIAQPLDIRSATFTVSPGGSLLPPLAVADASPLPGAPPLYESAGSAGSASPPGGPATRLLAGSTGSGAAVPGGVGTEISGLLETRDLTPIVLLGSLVAAMLLGAGHALTPGHGKTLMGAYLVGTRGTAVHAVALGLSVTVSHTLGIVVLAAIVVAFRDVVSPETFNRVAPIASGLLVLGIGAWLLTAQLRARRTNVRPAAEAAHDHGHGHVPPHEHDGRLGHGREPAGRVEHAPGLERSHGLDHDHDGRHVHEDLAAEHSHGGIHHSHVPAAGASVGWRSLFVLGLAGGIIPSTNALIILLATIATGRAAYGLVLVVAFGLGMAVVLGGVGLALVLARDRMDRLPNRSSLGRAASYAPLMAGALVLGLGIYLTGQAVGVAPTL